ncbi:hypothetical protein [Endozoicomonas lisbonensis]|uniref:Uncharacterized protein n=1 Tax=Endozoicomonas lisbonensis TaxID=3120522 RepID=A0ABV2SDQ6_9GAMM
MINNSGWIATSAGCSAWQEELESGRGNIRQKLGSTDLREIENTAPSMVYRSEQQQSGLEIKIKMRQQPHKIIQSSSFYHLKFLANISRDSGYQTGVKQSLAQSKSSIFHSQNIRKF